MFGLPLPPVSIAQAPSPSPAATPCAVATPNPRSRRFQAPSRVVISDASSAQFAQFNHDGHGSFILIVRYDGSKTALIPPTRDIDPALRAALEDYVSRITVEPTVDCKAVSNIFLIRFAVPSGEIVHMPIQSRPAAPSPSP